MDVTPQLIEQIDFAEKFRGYDQDQVDDFLERVGATIAELNKSLREANGRLEDAEAEIQRLRTASVAEPAPVAAAPIGDEEEMAQAARTLMLARRTADAAVADAHAEAQKLLAEAQAKLDAANHHVEVETDRLLVTARAEAAEIVQQATTEAERAASSRKDEIQREVAELDLRRTLLASDIAALEGRMTRYREKLDQVHGAVGAILDDPSVLRNEPPHEFVADHPVVEAVGYDLDVQAEDAERGGDEAALAVDAAVPEETVHDVTESLGDDQPEVLVSFEDGAPDSGRTDAVPSESDPWGPGSWSDAVASAPAEVVLVDDAEAVGQSTGSYGGLSQDRYLRDLDEAVNQPVADDDDAMAAFFEGDADAQSSRFGRRR